MARPPRQSGRARFYHDVQLRGPVPSALVHRPELDGHVSPALFQGALDWAASEDLSPDTAQGEEVLQRFDWLPILAGGDESGLSAIHRLIRYWLTTHGRFYPAGWRGSLTATRLTRMLTYMEPLTARADGPERTLILDSIARQARHLGRFLRGGRERGQLQLILARTLASLCLPEDKQIGPPVTPQLALTLRYLAEGDLPKSWRDIDVAVFELETLHIVEGAFRARRLSPPSELREALKVGRLYLGGFCTEAGGVVQMPSQHAPDRAGLARLSPVCRAEASTLLPPMGYGSVRSPDAVVVADLGRQDDLNGTGGFSLVIGTHPLIINCGRPSTKAMALVDRMAPWTDALHAPAAASSFDSPATRPAKVEIDEGALSLTLRFESAAGFLRRALHLDTTHQQLVGRDQPVGASTLRIHLAPGTTAETIDDGFLLHPPGLPPSRFAVDGAKVALEESVCAWEDGVIIPCLQLVLTPEAEELRWVFDWSS